METNNKLREALINIAASVRDESEDTELPCVAYGIARRVRRMAEAALAEPVCNCEVGTAEEQGERFKNFCRNHQFISVDSEDHFPPMYVCSNESCPLHDYYIAHGEDNCELAWAQMPYVEGGNDGK